MLGMLPVLGVYVRAGAHSPAAKVGPVLICKGKGVQATGYESSQGFVVQAGSQTAATVTPSFAKLAGPNELRADLLKERCTGGRGRCVLKFTQDYVFSAPSAASDIVLGGCTNGRLSWKDAQGRTLKELQEAEARQ